MSEELAHHPLGASASDRWLNCPGSVLATQHLPDTDTEYSIEGTAAHTLSEIARRNGLCPTTYIGQSMAVELVDGTFKPVEVTKEMADCVKGFIDYLSALPGDDYNEERVYIDKYVPGAFGTMDAAKVATRHAHIVDLKFGQGVEVDAYENPQLMYYALGFWLTYGWLYNIDTFTLHVYQPRRGHIDEWTISLGKLLEWADETLKPGAILAMKPGAPFKAGEWCTFCKLRQTCVTRAKSIFEMNLDELDDDLDAAVAKDLPAFTTLTSDQIAKILRRKSQVTKFFKDLDHYAFSEIKHGRAVGDFKMVEGKSNRAWSLPAGTVAERLKAAGLDPKLLFKEPQLDTPAAAERAYGKKTFGKDSPLADLVMKPPGKPVLVPGDDPRQAMDLSLVAELEDDDE